MVIGTDSLGPVSQGVNDTILGRQMVVGCPIVGIDLYEWASCRLRLKGSCQAVLVL